jgi:hypothetical protein
VAAASGVIFFPQAADAAPVDGRSVSADGAPVDGNEPVLPPL